MPVDRRAPRAAVLREPARRVSPRAQVAWAAAGLVRAGVLAAVLVLVTAGWHWFALPGWAWWPYGVLAAAYCVAMPVVRYRTHRWEATETAVYTQTGWVTVERRVAPMSRVQTVDVARGPVGRLLSLATVTVTTASARGPLRIPGLTRDVADRLAADLNRHAERDPGDAT